MYSLCRSLDRVMRLGRYLRLLYWVAAEEEDSSHLSTKSPPPQHGRTGHSRTSRPGRRKRSSIFPMMMMMMPIKSLVSSPIPCTNYVLILVLDWMS